MRAARVAFAVALDVAVWSLALWLLTAPPGQRLSPRAWHHTAVVCRTVARHFGGWAIEAERHYWKAVQA